MWQCPKCGREFKNLNQQHFCGEPDNSIDEYISLQPEEVRPILNELRGASLCPAGGSERSLAYADLLEKAQYHSLCCV